MTKSVLALFLALLILFATACSSSTMITSSPTNTRLFINGQAVGETPYRLRDSKIVFSETEIRLERNGYETIYATIAKDSQPKAGPIIGGFFLVIPWLWALGYAPNYHYVLNRTQPQEGIINPEFHMTKAERLMQLKVLYDEGILTLEEFEREKKRILEE